MSTVIRKYLSKKISEVVGKNNIFYELEVPVKSNRRSTLQWSCNILDAQQYNLDILKNIATLNYEKDLVKQVNILKNNRETASIEFVLHDEPYFNTLLKNQIEQADVQQEHMVFEYSSPNIAKPFHVGHLRSTIIGNFLTNIHKHLNYHVTTINYLGDWGTQLGMLHIGMEMLGTTSEQMQLAPIETLYEAYILANKAAETDATIYVKAREFFRNLETGNVNPDLIRKLDLYRDFTKKELQVMYERLGVHFDIFDWESNYSEKYIKDVIQKLEHSNILLNELDGHKAIKINQRKIPIIKKDGGTLYLTRDVAALLNRWQRFQFTRMYYVVENGQSDHFNACFNIATTICDELEHSKLKHVKFGRIHGMSTRKGQAVLLAHLLNEARDRMYEKQKQTSTTKIKLDCSVEDKSVADILGVSAVIINDLKQRRQRDYDFSWEKALQMTGDSGIKLQYTHCRLENLIQQQANNIIMSNIKADMRFLNEPEASEVLYYISKFNQSLWQSKEQLESCILVNYLFGLCNATSKALKRLPVKIELNNTKKLNRLLLFGSVRSILKCGMEVLGLKPLTKM